MENKEIIEQLFEYVNIDEESEIPDFCYTLSRVVESSDNKDLVNLAMAEIRRYLLHYQQNCEIKETAHSVVEVVKSLDWSKSHKK